MIVRLDLEQDIDRLVVARCTHRRQGAAYQRRPAEPSITGGLSRYADSTPVRVQPVRVADHPEQ
jgi:hypothetical protein